MQRPAAFAIPGDIETLTGGYIYERRLLEGLRALGRDVRHVVLGDSFPDPTPRHVADTVEALAAIEPGRVLILDGFIVGSLETSGLARVRAPVVAMVHHALALESGLDEARREHLFRTERDNLALAAHVLVPSPHTAEILATRYDVPPERITIARPGTDLPGGAPAPVDPPLILAVGIQHARNGHDILLKALARLRARDWQAVVVGARHDEGHAAALDRLHGDLGLGGRVRMAGKVSGEELDALFRAASVFALATRYEGYGIAFDEALRHGLPIVSCRTGAVPDTVPEGAGLLVAPDDAVAFAEALDTVLADAERRDAMARAAAAAGRALPGWEDTARIAGGVLDGV